MDWVQNPDNTIVDKKSAEWLPNLIILQQSHYLLNSLNPRKNVHQFAVIILKCRSMYAHWNSLLHGNHKLDIHYSFCNLIQYFNFIAKLMA